MPATNLPNGVNNVTAQNIFGQLKQPDPTQLHTYLNDFDTYVAANWTVTTTEAGSSSASQVINDEDGGVLLITNDNADNDRVFLQLAKETFKFEANKKAFFKACFKTSDAVESDLVFGLQIRDTTPLSVSDGVYFQKDDGDANLDFYVTKNSTSSSALAIATIANNTYITVAFYYNGKDEIVYAASANSNNPTILGKLPVTNLPDTEELTVSFGIQNGEAVAKTLSVDYILVAKER